MARHVRKLALAMLVLAGAPAHAGWFFKDKVTETFVQPAIVHEASLSPDGKHLAIVGIIAVDDEISTSLVLVDTESGQSTAIKRPETFADPDNPGARYFIRQPISVAWMSNDVMAVDFNNQTSNQVALDGSFVGWLGARFLGMVRLDGSKDKVALVKRFSDAEDLGTVALRSKEVTPLRLGLDSGPIAKMLTDSTGLTRVLQTIETDKDKDVTRVFTWFRDSETAKWRKVIDQSITDDLIEAAFISPEPNRLIVQARNAGDRFAMWNYDVERQAFADVAAAHPSEDIIAMDVQRIDFSNEGHSLWHIENQRDYYDAVFELLERTIGKGIAPADALAHP